MTGAAAREDRAAALPVVRPDEWRRFAREVIEPRHASMLGDAGAADGRWVSLTDMLAGDAALLRAAHAGLVAGGSAPQAAAKHLVGWIGGWLARTVGFAYAAEGAGVLADSSVRWRLLPGGWPDRVDVAGCSVVVPPGHGWAGGVTQETVVDGAGILPEAVVAALSSELEPLVAGATGLAKVGRAALWSEIADALGDAASGDARLAADPATTPALERLLAARGAPWRVRPRLWCATGESGPRTVCHRGGCCLAYLATPPPTETDQTAQTAQAAQPAEPAETATPEERARLSFAARFPPASGDRGFCANCRFREAGDVEERTVFWCDQLERERQRGPRAARGGSPRAR